MKWLIWTCSLHPHADGHHWLKWWQGQNVTSRTRKANMKRKPEIWKSTHLLLTSHNSHERVSTHHPSKIGWCSREFEYPSKNSYLWTLVRNKYGKNYSTCITSHNCQLQRHMSWGLSLIVGVSSTNSREMIQMIVISSRRRYNVWFRRGTWRSMSRVASLEGRVNVTLRGQMPKVFLDPIKERNQAREVMK